ncbi:MAG: DnaJ domain-containing protein [Eggerthellaceae bacterium]
MVKDPYEVLGVSRDASADEVKKAYRKKARENHPDLNPGDAKAAERMNEINEAYDRITNPEKYAASDRRAQQASNPSGAGASGAGPTGQGGYGYGPFGPYGYGQGQQGQGPGGAGQSGPYGWTTIDFDDIFGFGGMGGYGPIHPEASVDDTAEMRSAIDAINAKRYQQALNVLNAVTSGGRNARWYYLSALAHHGAGNSLMAHEQIRRALKMDPHNRDYQRAQQQFQMAGQAYQEEGKARGFSIGKVDPAMICCGLCLAQYACATLGRGTYF